MSDPADTPRPENTSDVPDAAEPAEESGPAAPVECQITLDLDRLRWLHARTCGTDLPEEDRRQAVRNLISSFPFLISALSVWHGSCLSVCQELEQAKQELEQTKQLLLELRHSRYEQASHRSSN